MIDIDSDDPDVIDAIRAVLPPSPWERTGKKGLALAYAFSRLPNFKLKGPDGAMIVELLGAKNQIVLPGSIHPDTGRPYTSNSNLWEVLDQVQPLPDDIKQRLQAALGLGQVVSKDKVKARLQSGVEPIALASIAGPVATYLGRDLADACAEIEGLIEGDRNNTLFKRAARVAELFTGAGADWQEAALALSAAGLTCGLTESAIAATLASAHERGVRRPARWLEVGRDWVFVAGEDKYFHLMSGSKSKPQSFRTEFAPLSDEGPIDRLLHENECIETVQGFEFDPTLPAGVVERDKRRWWNTYMQPGIVPVEGDCSPFQEYLEHLVPDHHVRAHLLQMLSYIIRNPGAKLNYALIMTSRQHGTGKSTLFDILFELLGSSNCRKATSEELESQYQAFLHGKQYVFVEELNFGKGLATYNRLKDLITSTRTPIRKMYQDTFEARNWANFGFCSNLMRPMLIEPEDRRLFVVAATEEKRPVEYWVEFQAWWRAHLPQIRYFFDQVDLSNFSPSAHPPMTDAKNQLIVDSRRPIVKDLQELLEGGAPPFNRDLVTRAEVRQALSDMMGMSVTSREVENAIRELGGKELGQHDLRLRTPGFSPTRLLGAQAAKPSLWALRHVTHWEKANRSARVNEFLAENGLFHTASDGVAE